MILQQFILHLEQQVKVNLLLIHGVVLNGCDCLYRNDIQTFFFSADAIAKIWVPDPENLFKQIELTNAFDFISGNLENLGTVKTANMITVPKRFKKGRDYFGDGTEENPVYFREGFLYHKGVYDFLEEQGFTRASVSRVLHSIDEQGAIDKWSDEEKTKTLYTKNIDRDGWLGN